MTSVGKKIGADQQKFRNVYRALYLCVCVSGVYKKLLSGMGMSTKNDGGRCPPPQTQETSADSRQYLSTSRKTSHKEVRLCAECGHTYTSQLSGSPASLNPLISLRVIISSTLTHIVISFITKILLHKIMSNIKSV